MHNSGAEDTGEQHVFVEEKKSCVLFWTQAAVLPCLPPSLRNGAALFRIAAPPYYLTANREVRKTFLKGGDKLLGSDPTSVPVVYGVGDPWRPVWKERSKSPAITKEILVIELCFKTPFL